MPDAKGWVRWHMDLVQMHPLIDILDGDSTRSKNYALAEEDNLYRGGTTHVILTQPP